MKANLKKIIWMGLEILFLMIKNVNLTLEIGNYNI